MKRLLLVVSLLGATSAPGGFESGEMLLQLCRSNGSVCLAYLEGVVDGAEALAWQGLITGLCVPQRVESAEVRDIFLDYADRQPHVLKLPAGILVIDALRDAWRCPPEK